MTTSWPPGTGTTRGRRKMPKLPGRASTFKTYPPDQLLIGYWFTPVGYDPKVFRCLCCGRTFSANDEPGSQSFSVARVALVSAPLDSIAGEVCETCEHKIYDPPDTPTT